MSVGLNKAQASLRTPVTPEKPWFYFLLTIGLIPGMFFLKLNTVALKQNHSIIAVYQQSLTAKAVYISFLLGCLNLGNFLPVLCSQ